MSVISVPPVFPLNEIVVLIFGVSECLQFDQSATSNVELRNSLVRETQTGRLAGTDSICRTFSGVSVLRVLHKPYDDIQNLASRTEWREPAQTHTQGCSYPHSAVSLSECSVCLRRSTSSDLECSAGWRYDFNSHGASQNVCDALLRGLRVSATSSLWGYRIYLGCR